MSQKLILRNLVKEVRKTEGLSQKELADKIGVSRNTICSIENGYFTPTAKLALLICTALDRKFEEIFFFG